MRGIALGIALCLLALGLVFVSGSATAYYEGEDACLPENAFEEPTLSEEEFALDGDIEIIDSPEIYQISFDIQPGENIEEYTLTLNRLGTFDVVETNLTELDGLGEYHGEGPAHITLEVNTTASLMQNLWESENYSAIRTYGLNAFEMSIATDEGNVTGEQSFPYTTFDPPREYHTVTQYDSDMVVFGEPERVITYETQDGPLVLVSDLEEHEFTQGLNYSRLTIHLEEDLNLTPEHRHRAIYLFPSENVTPRAGSCSARADDSHGSIIHEYIHLRQHDSIFTNNELRWMVEGTARYFDTTIPYHEGIGGTRSASVYFMERAYYPEVNLSDPDTWEPFSDYTKGGRAHAWMAYLGIDLQALNQETWDDEFDTDDLEAFIRTNARKDPSPLLDAIRNETHMQRQMYGDRWLNEQEHLLHRNDTRHTDQIEGLDEFVHYLQYNIESPVENLSEGVIQANATDDRIELELAPVGSGVDVYFNPPATSSWDALKTPKPRYFDATIDGEPVDYYFGRPSSDDPAFGLWDSRLVVEDLDLEESATLQFEFNESAYLEVTNPEYQPDESVALVEFDVVDTVVPETITKSEPFDITVTLEHRGLESGTESVTVMANGEAIGTESVHLEPGQNETVQVKNVSIDEVGSTDIVVETAKDTDAREVTVDPVDAPDFIVDELVSPENVTAEDEFSVNLSLENIGLQSGTQEVEIQVNERVLGSESVTLDSGEQTELTISNLSATDAGSTDLRVETQNETFETELEIEPPPAPEFQIVDSVAAESVQHGNAMTIDVTIENVGDLSGEVNVNLSSRELGTKTTTAQIEPGVNETVSLTAPTADIERLGVQRLHLEVGSVSSTVEFEVIPGPRTYADEQGNVTTDGVGAAFDDWMNGSISRSSVEAVFAEWIDHLPP